jgi:hypothetical protein
MGAEEDEEAEEEQVFEGIKFAKRDGPKYPECI